ncbi:uncharacterized protein KY384_007714 [Bacidia gigantensis]|uniref:uncharacterized protein n=1 Tax=Bacidia gigantensis TaxID=2732470 RepID=UPI001D0380B3|nr:uncharacterized protein KY384_007714 [Bacidia gigantensis]KAG8527562.1 hypothetical protein KY384_007714 [Bacidia gigantensis]
MMVEFNSFDDEPWILRLVEYTQKALEHPHVKVIGVCFGHQILGRALGSRVAKHERGTWEVSVCEVQQTEKGKELFGGKDVLMHKDIVCEYVSGVEALGSTDVCQVQGMYISRRLISVQGHPEFDEEIERELLEKRHYQGVFNKQLFTDGMRRVAKPQDGVLVAQGFLRFLME